MNKLSDYKDEACFPVIAKLMVPIVEICQQAGESTDDETAAGMLTRFFEECPRQMMDIMAILSDVEPKDYHCDGTDVLKNIFILAADEKLMQLFR